jgi:hypothetical protein
MKIFFIWLGRISFTLIKKIFPPFDDDIRDIFALLFGISILMLFFIIISIPLYFSEKKIEILPITIPITINIGENNSKKIEDIEKKMEQNKHEFYESKKTIPIFEVSPNSSDSIGIDIEGSYYIINISGAEKKEILFDIGEYVANFDDDRFLNPLNEFCEEMFRLDSLECDYRICVKGSADIVGDKTLEKKLVSNYGEAQGFTHIKCCKKIGENKFAYKIFVEKDILGNTYRNQDLPFLRAKFMQHALQKIGLPSILLEGEVDEKEDESLRNATLILCVDWKSCKDKWKNYDNNQKNAEE